jgi:hypothetical protein
VTVLWRALAADSEPVRRGAVSAARAVVPALCSLGVAAVLGATLCLAVAPAGANPAASLQQQASVLSEQMVLEQLQINGYLQQRSAYVKSIAADDLRLRRLEAAMGATRRHILEDRGRLRSAAVMTYVEGGTQAGGTSALFAATPSEDASTVYVQVMAGDLGAAEDRLQLEQRMLRAEAEAVQQLADRAHHEMNGADAALAAARSTEQELARQRAGITGELEVLIAREQVLRARQQVRRAAQLLPAASNAPTAGSPAPSTGGSTSSSSAGAPSAASSDTPAAPPGAAPSAPPSGASATPPSGAPAAPPGAAPPTPPSTGGLPPLNAFLRCVVQAESSGNYQAISPTGQYMGAFQFSQPTWDLAAGLAGMPTLSGVPPYQASPRAQDLLAIALYNADGEQPWYDPCRS